MNDLDCGNLVLTRRKNESIVIGDNVTVTVTGIENFVGGRVFLSVRAPRNIVVHRNEVNERIKEERGNV